MSKQDRGGVRTAQHLERKYNLGSMQKTTKQNAANVNRVEMDLHTFEKEISDEVNEKAKKEEIPTKVSDLTNDAKYVTETELEAKGYLKEVTGEDLPAEYLEQLIADAIENAYVEVENEAGGITVIIGHS